MSLQLLVCLCEQRGCLLKLVFQGLLTVFKTADSLFIKQCSQKGLPIGEAACGQCGGEVRRGVLQPLAFEAFLLLQCGKLALKRNAFVVRFAPVIRNGRFGFCVVCGGQGVEQRHQSRHALLHDTMLSLFFLPLCELGFSFVQPGSLCAFFRDVE